MKVPCRLSWGLALLMVGQSATGLLFEAGYRDADWIRAAWFANDWVTIAVAVPLLVVGLIRAASRSIRGTLLWLGLVSYAAYNYAYYMFGAALNAFFLLYVAGFVVAVIILILALPRLAVAERAPSCRKARRGRITGGYFVFIGAALAAVWIWMWGAYVYAGQPTPIETEAFKLVAALDLTLMVPPLMAGGVMLWRRCPWGYVISPLAGVQASLYLLVLAGGSLVAVHRGLVDAPGEVVPWGLLCVSTTAVTVLLLISLQQDPPVPAGDERRDVRQNPG